MSVMFFVRLVIDLPVLRSVNPFPTLRVDQSAFVDLLIISFFVLIFGAKNGRYQFIRNNSFGVLLNVQLASVERVVSIFLAEFVQDFRPHLFLFVFQSDLLFGGFRNAPATRYASLTVNRNVLVVVNGNVIG